MLSIAYNLVVFSVGGASVQLTLEDAWTMTAGVKPDVNRAVVPYGEYVKIASQIGVKGSIRFYGSSPSVPNLSLDQVRIVDVEPLTVGIVAGETVPRVIDYRLFFADRRADWLAPRGGYLRKGKINTTSKTDGQAYTEMTNSEIISAAAGALYPGLVVNVPASVNGLPKMRNLEWNGSHAGEELEKALEYVGCALCLKANGAVAIEQVGVGTTPAIAAEDLVADVPLPAVARRARTLVLTSAPTATADIIDEQQASPWTWKYVVKSDSGAWVEQTTLCADPIKGLKTGFANAEEKHRAILQAQAFRCIQIDLAQVKPAQGAMMARSMDDSSQLVGAEVWAKCAQWDGCGYINAQNVVRCEVVQVDQQANVLVLRERLVKVATAGLARVELSCEALDAADLRLRVAREAVDGATGKKLFYNAAFEVDANGAVTQLSTASADAILDSGGDGTINMPMPQWRLLRRWDGAAFTEVNRTVLDQEAAAIAAAVLGGVQDTRTLHARGFQAVETSGRVTRVRWDQASLLTTIDVDAWQRPSLALSRDQIKNYMDGFRSQSQTMAERSDLGGAGAIRSTQPAGAAVPAAIPLDGQLGVVVCSGPNGEGDFSTNSYWVQQGEFSMATGKPQVTAKAQGWIVQAVNMFECEIAHNVSPQAPVMLFSRTDSEGRVGHVLIAAAEGCGGSCPSGSSRSSESGSGSSDVSSGVSSDGGSSGGGSSGGGSSGGGSSGGGSGGETYSGYFKVVTDVFVSGTVLKRKVRTLTFSAGVLTSAGTEVEETVDEGVTCS